MSLSHIIDAFGDRGATALAGLAVGLVFGALAQRSQFCLRAATVELWRGLAGAQRLHDALGPKTAVWLLVFGVAVAGTQALLMTGQLDSGSIRQLAATGTMSGALIGGAMFGAGMVLARGCASRLLVLSATGNLRALVSGLILTVVAQAALTGVLSPVRLWLADLWTVSADARNLNLLLPKGTGLGLGLATMALGLVLALRHRLAAQRVAAGAGVGGAIILGWWLTAAIAARAFDPIAVESVTFTGPSTDTLMVLIARPDMPLSFGIGLIPGVFAGAMVSAFLAGEIQIQTFGEDAPLPRYIAGACLMGFGSMLAGGCAVGAGVTGGALMASTAWVALAAMWAAAGVADLFVDRPRSSMRGVLGVAEAASR